MSLLSVSWKFSAQDRKTLYRALTLPTDICSIVVAFYVDEHVRSNGLASAAKLSDGSVVAWGDGARGGNTFLVRDQLVGVRQLYVNNWAFAAVLDTGRVVTWGSYFGGSISAKTQASLTGVIEIFSFDELMADAGCKEDDFDLDLEELLMLESTEEIYPSGSAFVAKQKSGRLVAWGNSDLFSWMFNEIQRRKL